MSSSAAFAGSSAANNAAAQAAAHQAKVERCILETGAFEPKTATVMQQQSYADCISTLYPAELSGNEVLAYKFAIVVIFIALIIGAWRGWRDNGLGEAILMGVCYAVGVFMVMVAVLLIAAGVLFLVAA